MNRTTKNLAPLSDVGCTWTSLNRAVEAYGRMCDGSMARCPIHDEKLRRFYSFCGQLGHNNLHCPHAHAGKDLASHAPDGATCTELIGRMKQSFPATLRYSTSAAESLGLPHLSAYLDAIGSNFSYGANFATAGSTIRRQNMTLFQSGFSPFDLEVQFWQFSQFQSRSQLISKQGGLFKELLPKEEHFSSALYTFDIGQNDLTSGYFLNMSTEEVKAYIPGVLDKFVTVIKDIYQHGGRIFWIHNTGPFGCLPYVIERIPLTVPQVDHYGCGVPFNQVAQLFNSKLKETVERLRKDLPLAAFTYVDIYSIKYSLITNAKAFGFEHPLVSCCGHGGKYNYNRGRGCGAKVVINGTEILLGKSCENPWTRIIWDGVHYTEAANKWVFNQISTGVFSDPPIPVTMACQVQ